MTTGRGHPGANRRALRYVALGDSYTIGTAVDPADSWPAQLAAALASRPHPGASLRLVANLALNGRTSAELVREQLPELPRWEPEFVSLLVGVNDVVRGARAGEYEDSLRAIFETLLRRLPPGRIVTVGTPDYTVTPRGADFGDPGERSREIAAFNGIMASVSAEHGVRHVEVFDLSQRAAADRSLVAGDGLHPSAAQYGLWVERIALVVAGLLGGSLAELQ